MLSLLIAATLAFSAEDADFAWKFANELVERHTPRDAGTAGGQRAADFIFDVASRNCGCAGWCDFRAPSPSGEKSFRNVYAEFARHPGEEWTLVVSHYDTKPRSGCPGANDGASTSALLAALARKLANCEFECGNVLIVWTDGEECEFRYSDNDGLQGSIHAAERLLKSDRKVKNVICLDMLGDCDLRISIPANSTERLAQTVMKAAEAIGEPKLVERSDDIVKDDHLPFLVRGMDAIDLIDFEYGKGNAYWHTPEDSMKRISKESLLKSGRLVCETLNRLLKK